VKEHFFDLAEHLGRRLPPGELLLCSFSAERSDFVRFNRARVRQAGSVEQRFLSLRLVRSRRQAGATLVLAGTAEDTARAETALGAVRRALEGLPEDPWLLVNEAPCSTDVARRGRLAPAQEAVGAIIAAAGGRDLVGFYAAGTLYRGFANSLGQRNWHEVDGFNFDWSLHREADLAAKAGYAGFDWDAGELARRMDDAAQALGHLGAPRRLLAPGEYRAFLAPRALEELVGLLAWGGFSARARATRQSPLLRMQEGARLSAKIDLAEHIAEGIAPAFQSEGFVKPPRVPLIVAGALGEALVSPRSAREYGLATNAASGAESPLAPELAPGALAPGEVLAALDRGLYISNLWYLNYSDRPAARITGMTRFATFWVERGRIAGPVAPMRFDDDLYRMLGENLVELTREREWLVDPATYGERSTHAARLPGALLSALRFTL